MKILPVVSVLPMILQNLMHMLEAYLPESDWFSQFDLLYVDDKQY
jgi:hypothetical protein